MVATLLLGSNVERRVGSSPIMGTMKNTIKQKWNKFTNDVFNLSVVYDQLKSIKCTECEYKIIQRQIGDFAIIHKQMVSDSLLLRLTRFFSSGFNCKKLVDCIAKEIDENISTNNRVNQCLNTVNDLYENHLKDYRNKVLSHNGCDFEVDPNFSMHIDNIIEALIDLCKSVEVYFVEHTVNINWINENDRDEAIELNWINNDNSIENRQNYESGIQWRNVIFNGDFKSIVRTAIDAQKYDDLKRDMKLGKKPEIDVIADEISIRN